MRLCQRGVLQFVAIKPVFAILDIIAISCGFYYVPAYQYFEMCIYNVSYTWALYCMFVFYLATSHIIRNFRPVMKFASVKIIVFATYYQSLAIKAGPMPTEDSVVWNDLILCVEMVLFAIMHCLAYPTSEFQGGTPDSTFIDNVKDVMKLSDVMQDMYHNFTPIYHDYGLQRSEKEMSGSVVPTSSATGILSGNLDSVAVEMSHRYRGRNRRFAFNSLLRGDRPIKARLRPLQGGSDVNSDDESCNGDIEEGINGREATSSHGLLKGIGRDSLIDSSAAGIVKNPLRNGMSKGDSDHGGVIGNATDGLPNINTKTNIDQQEINYSDDTDSPLSLSSVHSSDQAIKRRTHGLRYVHIMSVPIDD